MPPKCAAERSIMARHCSRLPISTISRMAEPPLRLISSSVSRPGPSLRVAMTTLAPSLAKRTAVSRPIPLPAPVMIAILPASRPIFRYPVNSSPDPSDQTKATAVAGEPTAPGKRNGRTREQEGAALDLAQIARQIAQPEHFAQVNAELEQAAVVQRQEAVMTHVPQRRIDGLDRRTVGDQGDDTALARSSPATLRPCRLVPRLSSPSRAGRASCWRSSGNRHSRYGSAGSRPVLTSTFCFFSTCCILSMPTSVLPVPNSRARSTSTPRPCTQVVAIFSMPSLLAAGPPCAGASTSIPGRKAVVVHRHFHPAPVHVEHAAPMRERIPLRGILQAHRDAVVAADVLGSE